MTNGGCNELRDEFRCSKLGLGHSNPRLFVIPQCVPSKFYIIWAAFWALFYTVTLSFEIYYNLEYDALYFIYLTSWSYLVQAALVFTDLAVTLYVQCARKDLFQETEVTSPWYVGVLWVLFNVNNTTAVIVTSLYYGLLDPKFNHGSVNTHLLNSVYTLLTLMFSAKPVQLLHVYQPMIYSVCYIIFSIIWHYTGNDPVYSVLDWSDPGSAARISLLMLFVGAPVMHVFMYALYTFRVWISEKCNCICSTLPDTDKPEKELTTKDVELSVTSASKRHNNNTVCPE